MYLRNGLGAVDPVLGQEYSLDDFRESPVSCAFVVHLGSIWLQCLKKGEEKGVSGKGKFLLKIVPPVLE